MKNLMAALMVVSAIGCGGGGGGSGFSTSVPGSKPLGTLSTADAKTLCTDTASYVMSRTKALESRENQCRATGIAFAAVSAMGSTVTDAMLQAACQAGYEVCQSSPQSDAGTDPTVVTIDCTDATPPDATCTATVAQYDACLTEQLAAVQNLFMPCTQLTKAKLATFTSANGDAPTMGPACTAFAAACPGYDNTMNPLGGGSP